MASLSRLRHLLVVLVVISATTEAKFGSRPRKAPSFKYFKNRCNSTSDPDLFPTSFHGLRKYQPRFHNPTTEDLFANVNMETEDAKVDLAFLETMSPPRVVEVIPGKVYQAQFFALGWPVIFITPQDTLIWVDAPESAPAAVECIAAFRAIPAIGNKPIVALIYTIFHADHIWGAGPIVNDPMNNGVPPVIISHSEMLAASYQYDTFKGFKGPRLYRMFASFVPDPPHIHDGGVHRLRLEGPYIITEPPTDLLHFSDPTQLLTRTIGEGSLVGLELEFVSVPGYTKDQIMVWVKDWSTLHGADVYYLGLPNLYTLRGEPGRDVLGWAEGTRKAASYNADVLVVTHSFNIQGAALVKETLTTYADGIQYLHDQTVRYMSKGYPPDVIPAVVNLPPNLASNPSFDPGYGIEDTAIKGIFDFYVGWFSGLAEDIFPIDRFERGSKLIDIIGRSQMKIEAAKAYNNKEYEWSIELATYLWRDDENDVFALELRTESLKRLAELQNSVVGRNYLLSAIVEDWNLVDNVVKTSTSFILLHLDGAMKNLQFHLDNELVADITTSLYLDLTDGPTFKLNIRNSILEYIEVDQVGTDFATLHVKDNCDLTDSTDVFCWRFMLAGFFPFSAVPAAVVSNGTPNDVIDFFAHFDFTDEISGGYSPNNT
ncbi:hypothetical protein CAPTEDRAFT_217011 [Capitella teleta]|uniref:Metallo-beta-lactamase domain-containing protein n=1 Tax=Capitella teleta TaxID=283909 RepID=R7TME0_CAPTE|nr:hypothetical protein CAPTEDRAFT_217011 [Capitella teleta]|eukprot:ELT95023.1 hypothetical protein CAPTEDRAFT_217011 [Capitella teleta]